MTTTEQQKDALLDALPLTAAEQAWVAERAYGCIYCDSEVMDNTIVPSEDDDTGWAVLASEHRADCEWILTRAHRVDQHA